MTEYLKACEILATPSLTAEKVARNIRTVRETLQLPQREIADKLHVSQPVYCQLEHGDRKLSVDWMLRIARAMQVSPIVYLLVAMSRLVDSKLVDMEASVVSQEKKNE